MYYLVCHIVLHRRIWMNQTYSRMEHNSNLMGYWRCNCHYSLKLSLLASHHPHRWMFHSYRTSTKTTTNSITIPHYGSSSLYNDPIHSPSQIHTDLVSPNTHRITRHSYSHSPPHSLKSRISIMDTNSYHHPQFLLCSNCN